jgi:hypothetical protein
MTVVVKIDSEFDVSDEDTATENADNEEDGGSCDRDTV